MLRTNDATQNLFDEWAKTYAEDLENASGPLFGYKHSLEEAGNMIRLKNGDSILDVGIGTGAFAASIAEGDTQVWGIDLSEKMLEQCKKLYPDYHLQQGTFTEPGLERNNFDAIVSSFCFHEVLPEERERACQKMFELLKPGGTFLLIDIMFASVQATEEARKQLASTGIRPRIIRWFKPLMKCFGRVDSVTLAGKTPVRFIGHFLLKSR
jgi:putative AdoMet-dependent methyltransferase